MNRLNAVAALLTAGVMLAAVLGMAADARAGDETCRHDLTGDGRVDVDDLVSMLAAWGECPGVRLAAPWNDLGAGHWQLASSWAELEALPEGGNPGGCVRAVVPYSFSGVVNRLDHPAFPMSLASEPEVHVSVDLRFESGAFADAWLYFGADPGTGGWTLTIQADFDATDWTRYAVPFDPTMSDAAAEAAGWWKEPGAPGFAETMQNLEQVAVMFLASDGSMVGVDNFRISDGSICDSDVNDDGRVDVDDLVLLTTVWGECP